MEQLHKILPFFPLGVFLLPGEDIPLRIFEPKYLQLIEEAKDEGFTFAIPFVRDDEILHYGCEVKLQQLVAETENGRKVITVESVNILKVNSFTSQIAGKLYAGGSVQVLSPPGKIQNREVIDLIVAYRDHFDKDFPGSSDLDNLSYFDVVRALQLSSEDKYNFILLDGNAGRDRYLSRQLNYLMLIRKQEKMLNDDFRLN
ncbi:MAG: LON peptidase substrate-binding domain-containing protein [Bacteroidales bacterium]|nr:LON peptidase substrate-binding domain-containing protein [Bacteroidales bacterium]